MGKTVATNVGINLGYRDLFIAGTAVQMRGNDLLILCTCALIHQIFNLFLKTICIKIEKQNAKFSCSISATSDCLAITLRYLATGKTS